MSLPPAIQRALDETGLPYVVENGDQHRKLRVAGKLVGILPKTNRRCNSDRAEKNVIAQIRRSRA